MESKEESEVLGFYDALNTLEYPKIYHGIPKYAKIYQSTQKYSEICQNTARIPWNTPKRNKQKFTWYAEIDQNLSEYAKIY